MSPRARPSICFRGHSPRHLKRENDIARISRSRRGRRLAFTGREGCGKRDGGGYFIVYGLIMLVNISPGDDSSGGTNEAPRLRATPRVGT